MKSTRIVTKTTASIVSILGDNEAAPRIFSGNCMELLAALPDDCIDLTVTSPPYCMNKEYEAHNDIASFIAAHKKILPQIARVTRPGGSICWQVGFHVKSGVVAPLDYLVHEVIAKLDGIFLRNRIVWTYGHGLHCDNRFSGRYEVVMWYSKGERYYFDLDAVRVPQKYPGKTYAKGPKKGQLSGNPKGKNPSDFWDGSTDDVWAIPNVKAHHIEKTIHPCQFPVALATRLVRALSPAGGLVLDPFAGVASTGVAAVLDDRRFIGAELFDKYLEVAELRLREAMAGTARIRPLGKEIRSPVPTEKVAIRPAHFWSERQPVARP